MRSDISVQVEDRAGEERDGPRLRAMSALPRRPALVVAAAFLLAFFINAAASGYNIVHPFIFMDDLIWEIDKGIYYSLKLPAEGRWLVFGWNHLFGIWPAAATYVLALASWCFGAAVVGELLAPQDPPKAILAGVALASCPSMLNVLMWPHTALPMFATFAVAMSAIWIARGSGWARLLAIFGAAAVAGLTYQTLALLIMAAIVTSIVLAELRNGSSVEHTVARLIAPALVCALGAAAGMAIAFSLNLAAFGHFGLVIEPWRVGVHNQDRSRAVIALRSMAGTAWFLTRQTLGVLPALLAITFGALGLSARRAPKGEGRPYLLVLLVLLAICAATWLVVFLTRAPTGPDRSGTLVWFAAIGAALACAGSRPRLAYGALTALLVAAVATGAAPFAALGAIQERNDRVIERVRADLALEETSPARAVYVVGTPSPLSNDQREPVQEWWVSLLLDRAMARQPLPVRPVYCSGGYNASSCGPVAQESVREAIAHMPSYPTPGYVRRSGDLIIVKLGPSD